MGVGVLVEFSPSPIPDPPKNSVKFSRQLYKIENFLVMTVEEE